MARRVTAHDVARHAGVSQSTVSRALADDARVHPATRARVQHSAGVLGYTPNALARGLITQRTGLLGVVMADMTAPFYPLVLAELTQLAQAAGWHVLLLNASDGTPDDATARALQYQVDAVLLTSALLSSALAHECARLGIPVVLVNRHTRHADVNAVCCDNVLGARWAAQLLAASGCQHVAYLGGKPGTSTHEERRAGFLNEAAARHMIAHDVPGSDYTYGAGHAAMTAALRAHPPLDGVFAANDIMALGALDALAEAGRRAPDDVCVVGFDNIPQAALPRYSLSTLAQPISLMLDTALALLAASAPADAPDTPRPATQVFLPPTLVARRTTRATTLPPHTEAL